MATKNVNKISPDNHQLKHNHPTDTQLLSHLVVDYPRVLGKTEVFLANLVPSTGKGVLQLNSLFRLPSGQVHSKAKHHWNASRPNKLCS